MENPNPAPTGCYKCGRPGHWSRDCPSIASNPSSNSKPAVAPKSAAEKPKKAPRTRPKLTPELLLSDDGIGYVLRHFPRAFRYRGRGHEVSDLGNLIRLYREWHSHLLPYYSFDHFVRKVEQVAATKRVKLCIQELRERVASGGDPTKLHEHPDEHNAPNDEQDSLNSDGLNNDMGDLVSKDLNAGDLPEAMLNEIYEKATEERDSEMAGPDEFSAGSSMKELPNHGGNKRESCANEAQTREEQGVCEESYRLKMPDNAVAGSSSEFQITEEQRARMEANRLKALERAAARARLRQAP